MVRGESQIVVSEGFNLILAMASRSAHMQVGRIFIAENAVLDFRPLSLVSGNGNIVSMESDFD